MEPGGTAELELDVSEEAPSYLIGDVYTHEDGWHKNEGLVLTANKKSVVLTINWQDGGIGDADGVVNGIIVNP